MGVCPLHPPAPNPIADPLLTFLPVGHGLLALAEHAEEAVGAVGVPAAVLSHGARGQAQPKVLVAEVPVGAGGARAARCHLWKGGCSMSGDQTPSLTPGQARNSSVEQKPSVCTLGRRIRARCWSVLVGGKGWEQLRGWGNHPASGSRVFSREKKTRLGRVAVPGSRGGGGG